MNWSILPVVVLRILRCQGDARLFRRSLCAGFQRAQELVAQRHDQRHAVAVAALSGLAALRSGGLAAGAAAPRAWKPSSPRSSRLQEVFFSVFSLNFLFGFSSSVRVHGFWNATFPLVML